jgi:hypothetical protein
MAPHTQSAEEQKFSELIGKVFTDPKFAQAMEHDPEKALKDHGIHLNEHQKKALTAGKADVRNLTPQDATQVAAFVRPVVSVLTKGTQPAVQVVRRGRTGGRGARREEVAATVGPRVG